MTQMADWTEAEANGILDTAWDEMKRATILPNAELPELDIPQFTPDEAQRRAGVGRDLLRRIAKLDRAALDPAASTAIGVAEEHARRWSREADWYYTVFECGGWFKSMFAPTGDAIGRLTGSIVIELKRLGAEGAAAQERYLEAVKELARVIDQLRVRTVEQARQGIYMPRAMVEPAIGLLEGLKSTTIGQIGAVPARTADPAFGQRLDALLQKEVSTAFDRFLAVIDGDYRRCASDRVGIGQYPGGAEIYQELIRQSTTLDVSAEEAHRRGHEQMAIVRARMAEIASTQGFGTDVAAYRAHLDRDPRWRAKNADEITALFDRYISRMDAVVRAHFSLLPAAGHAAAPLPAELEGTMSYGYYDQPRPGRPVGLYLFNTANFMGRGLFDVAAFTFHELVPGHHLHFATQQENASLHPLQRHTFCNGFNEGWAEYARWYAELIGMYHEPAEQFGSLFSDARQASRLVVDTGLNVLGWDYEQARAYMRETLMYPDAEVQSLIRWYACEIPAQSLSYKLCQMEMLRLRQKAMAAMGPRFDPKAFHAAAVERGGRPFHLVEADIDRLIAAVA